MTQMRISNTQHQDVLLVGKSALRETSPLLVEAQSTVYQDNVRTTVRSSIWINPWFLSVSVTTVILLPTLIVSSVLAAELTGRIWPSTIFSFHLSFVLLACYFRVPSDRSTDNRMVTSAASLVDIALCGFVYPPTLNVWNFFVMDIDGTTIEEWKGLALRLDIIKLGFSLTLLSRLLVGGLCCLSRCTLPFQSNVVGTFVNRLDTIGRRVGSWVDTIPLIRRPYWKRGIRMIYFASFLFSIYWSILCSIACLSHFTSWQPWWRMNQNAKTCCDDLDLTECALPFPSFHHMVPDNATKTGWRVDLQGLPVLRGDIPLNVSFLTGLDGFSTMAPILFYLDGIWESHQARRHGSRPAYYPGLVGEKIEDSITNRSITLLWNVDTQELVPHTAKMDNLDPTKPLILVIPSQPLHRKNHYAVALVGANDAEGHRLPPSPVLQSLLLDRTTASCPKDSQRGARYRNALLPSLRVAAPWVNQIFDSELSLESLQMLFDFVTASEDSLEPIRKVRDATLQYVAEQGGWSSETVRAVKIYDQNCGNNHTLVARTIHGSLNVPWWLRERTRDSTLSVGALESKVPTSIGQAKFVIYVPCSLRAAAVNDTTRIQRPVRAVVEYGHGLFYNRQEADGHAMLRVAEDEGYVLVAMDWRGMSSFDMPVIMKALLSAPELFEATRDNLIQGYANKIALQSLIQDWLWSSDWLAFKVKKNHTLQPIRLFENRNPVSVFYGSSEGGVLGAGYTTLLGSSGLIRRCILGVPGTSFSVILTRSKSFFTYDGLLIKNFYNNRDVRIFMSVNQMVLDPVEAAGMLAPPVSQVVPRTLLQSGLGDAIIPQIATEALARAYNASILPNNPRQDIFGIPVSTAANESWSGPHASLTEVLYTREYRDLPLDEVSGDADNVVHVCVRQDCSLIAQLAAFVNTGRVIDPCIADRCIRTDIPCYVYWKRNNTIPKNWTCDYTQLLT